MKKTTTYPRLLLVDDDRHVLASTADWLRCQNYQVDTAHSFTTALAAAARRPYDVVLSDIRLGDGDGLQLVSQIKARTPSTAVIVLTGYSTMELAITALRAGAFDFLTKPLLDNELETAIERALNQRQLLDANRQLGQQLDRHLSDQEILGSDSRMVQVFERIERIADTKATVLITGESGTGKSMIARAIHRRSSRRAGPFVELACGALPEPLLESELFGHVAGAFTGAAGEKIGKFRQADAGTIFLDEISTASPSMQVKLLRVLQDFEFEAVGGSKTHRVDTRVILATNEDLGRAVAERRFRRDLYYRVNVITIDLPALRDRTADIPLLAEHFLRRTAAESNRSAIAIAPEAVEALCRYDWPGNVRELQNVIERAVLLGNRPVIGLPDLPPEVALAGGTAVHEPAAALKAALTNPERQIILRALEANAWNRGATADSLGINRTTLYKKMKRLGLEEPAMV